MMNESKFKVGDKVRMKHGMGKGEVFEVISVGKFWSGRDALGLSGNGGIAVDASQVEHYLENQPAPVAEPVIEDVLAVKNAEIARLQAENAAMLQFIQGLANPLMPQLEKNQAMLFRATVHDAQVFLANKQAPAAPQAAVTNVQPKFKVGDKVIIAGEPDKGVRTIHSIHPQSSGAIQYRVVTGSGNLSDAYWYEEELELA